MTMRPTILSAKRKLATAVFLGIAVLTRAAEPEPDWFLVPEPAFLGSVQAEAIAGAVRTVLAAFLFREGVLERPEPGGVPPFERIREESASWLMGFLDRAETEFIRDKNRVITAVVIRSDEPFVAAAAFAPGFAKRFRDTLGDRVLVAVPSRYVAYVFPGAGGAPEDFAAAVWREYRATPYPCSTEVFLLGEGREPRATGRFEEP